MSISHVAKRIKKLRESAGWSQSKLARESGLTAATINSLERMDNRMPSLESIKKIAAALKVGQETLVDTNFNINESGKDVFYREWGVLLLLSPKDKKLVKILAERLSRQRS